MPGVAPLIIPAVITASVTAITFIATYRLQQRMRRSSLQGPRSAFRKSLLRLIFKTDDLHLTRDADAVYQARSEFHDAADAIEVHSSPWVQRKVRQIDMLVDQMIQCKAQWFDPKREVRPYVALRYAELSTEARALGDRILRRI